MRKIEFYKLQGTGNDFIVINQMKKSEDLTTEEINFMCDRRIGIGADGLILLRPSRQADFKMVYFNADGNESTMCGNGGRCITKLYHFLYPDKGTEFRFQAIDGYHQAQILDNGIVSLEMKDVKEILEGDGHVVLNTGSPHYVTFRKDLFTVDVDKEGARIRLSKPYVKQGINVNFVDVEKDFIAVRTYERGVEGETLSCGTGVTAAAIAADKQYDSRWGDRISVHTKGGTLHVAFDKNEGIYTNIRLQGPAAIVFRGWIEL